MFLDIEKAFDTTWHTGLLYNPNWNFRSAWLSLLVLFCHKENSESWLKAKCKRQG
jgi:hypothetical protein